MSKSTKNDPALVVEYTDHEEGFKGWLVIDTLDHKLHAGGVRVQKGLSREYLCEMAKNMTKKMRIARLRVNGGKSGIDYDPASPGKHAAVGRFLKGIYPYVKYGYSMGPDLNLGMAELEEIVRGIGVSSAKMAIAEAQGWELSYFLERYAILHEKCYGATVGTLRAGTGVAQAALATLEFMNIPFEKATVALQGFGFLARAIANHLHKSGVNIIAISDAEKSIRKKDRQAIDINRVLNSSGLNLPDLNYGESIEVGPNSDIYKTKCDVFVAAAVEKTITQDVARVIDTRAVVPGANLAVTDNADAILYQRKIVVLPDFVAGCGGSLAMEGLFGPKDHPKPSEVLDYVKSRMSKLVQDVLTRSVKNGITPTAAALQYCDEVVPGAGQKPYGDIEP